MISGVGLSAEEPKGSRGIVDGDTPLRERSGVRRNKLEARVDSSLGGGLEGAWGGERRLGDRVVFCTELKDDVVPRLSRDTGWAESKSATITDENLDIRSIRERSGSKGKCSSREMHVRERTKRKNYWQGG